ncbi:hypothetical protein OHA40_30470 [Nocardia sp. NBC_00508]|uniref:hypothetical protein n=1 Tax=Nocardia sp. NBC_00508 TaxID=2975992 RepID=UPI002E803BB6|nr:hypothetical protein [Nocardia sp. NBC_00508]WUD65872.1 hypothetical protein OHA40_30470 [Nocardia sp. NBC_00508]
MINAKKTIAACAGVLGITAGLTAFLPVTASAATYEEGMCGAGYKVIDSHELKNGTVFLTYNGDQKCVVTVRNHRGAAERMGAGISLEKDVYNDVAESGDFTWYAGPVRIAAKGQCIVWVGWIGSGEDGFIGKGHCD